VTSSLDISLHIDRNGAPRLSVSAGRGKTLPVEVSHAFVELVRLEANRYLRADREAKP